MKPPVHHADGDRIVEPNERFSGMTQICVKAGDTKRCFQMQGVGEAVEEALRAHIKQTLGK